MKRKSLTTFDGSKTVSARKGDNFKQGRSMQPIFSVNSARADADCVNTRKDRLHHLKISTARSEGRAANAF